MSSTPVLTQYYQLESQPEPSGFCFQGSKIALAYVRIRSGDMIILPAVRATTTCKRNLGTPGQITTLEEDI